MILLYYHSYSLTTGRSLHAGGSCICARRLEIVRTIGVGHDSSARIKTQVCYGQYDVDEVLVCLGHLHVQANSWNLGTTTERVQQSLVSRRVLCTSLCYGESQTLRLKIL